MLVIWDFDGVLCDSLYECVTVTQIASYALENPLNVVTQENHEEICGNSVVDKLYEKMIKLRPFVVNGQDYIWFYCYFDELICCSNSIEQFQRCYDEIWNVTKDKIFEKIYYDARKLLAKLKGVSYLSLLNPYPHAISALRYTIENHEVYICSARDKISLTKWLESNSIDITQEFIYSRDYNGLDVNEELSKTEQIRLILDKEGVGKDDSFFIIEDQVKVPVELKKEYAAMKVICAGYGYGLRQSWVEAGLNQLRIINNPAELIPEITRGAV